jgi:predicted Co/Zn/Cd cation transporter (cation efflux family)
MRLGFRQILPVFLLTLYVILVVSGERQREPLTPEDREFLANSDMLRAPPVVIQIALAVNLPAIALALPVALAVHYLGGRRVKHGEGATYSVVGCFVPILWYLVGRWVDRRTGRIPSVMRKPSKVTKACLVLLVILTLLAAAASAGSHLAGGDRVMRLSVFLWSPFGAAVLYVRMTRETRKTE